MWCEEEKYEENPMNFRDSYISQKLLGLFISNVVCKVLYMKTFKYVDLIEIGTIVLSYDRLKLAT